MRRRHGVFGLDVVRVERPAPAPRRVAGDRRAPAAKDLKGRVGVHERGGERVVGGVDVALV